jgi:hypothetical protein
VTPLPRTLSLEEIAERQGGLVDELMALEEEVGDPLYYPFEIGTPNATRPLPGYLFKLPALFVASFPQLANSAPVLAPAPERRTLQAALAMTARQHITS